jgi:hypothetical protein
MVQQITSLVNLFPALSSGGLYFLEDLQTSYMEQYGGGYLNEKTTIEFIKIMIDGFYGQGSATELIEQVRSIHCFHELCLFIKKEDESVKSDCVDENCKAKADYFKKFLEIALESGTDKVTDHHYNYAYQQYLPDLRHSPVRFVEIGLGCDMHYGPGKSLDLWDRYFTHKDAQIFFMEYDAICAEKLHLSRPRVSVDAGDQANVTVLNSFIEKHGGNFDIIVDDGGHTMVQQITSLVNLFPALSSGGLYFLEDLQTSYMEQYGGGYLNEKTTIEYIKRMIDGLYGQGSATELIEQVRSIHCFHELCVFIKKDDM